MSKFQLLFNNISEMMNRFIPDSLYYIIIPFVALFVIVRFVRK